MLFLCKLSRCRDKQRVQQLAQAQALDVPLDVACQLRLLLQHRQDLLAQCEA